MAKGKAKVGKILTENNKMIDASDHPRKEIEENQEINAPGSQEKETENIDFAKATDIDTDTDVAKNIVEVPDKSVDVDLPSDSVNIPVSDNTVNKNTDINVSNKKRSKYSLLNIVRLLFLAGFIVFTALFINEVIIQPYRIKKSIDYTRQLYNRPTEAPMMTSNPTIAPAEETLAVPTPKQEVLTSEPGTDTSPTVQAAQTVEVTPAPDPNKDEQGRLLDFKDLLAVNEDVKGWLTIPGTDIDYVVMQSQEDDPDYYLNKDINKEYSKAGTLYLYYRASVKDTKNYVIFGHNMTSTVEKMFHPILDYKKNLSCYKKSPVITFNTIYDNAKWKIFAVFITPPDADKDYFFDYRKSEFTDDSDFLNFVYQIRIRSLLNIDAVKVNENDQLLMLSTCSYEVNHNYRTVLVARKVRDGEDPDVEVDSAAFNEDPLYAKDYYDQNGGKAPKLYATFEEALSNKMIHWYDPPKDAGGEK